MTVVGAEPAGLPGRPERLEDVLLEALLELPAHGRGLERQLPVPNENRRRHGDGYDDGVA
jgi:hypothetical protein